MRKRYPFIRTKFIPPLVKDTNLYRPVLSKKLRRILDVPITLIHSGPGYGKSSSIASFLENHKGRYCWYTLSKQEDHFIPFLVQMIYAVQVTFPSFGQSLLEFLVNENIDNMDEEIEFLCSEFINELVGMDESVIIVLDDIHYLESSSSSIRWLSLLIQYLPKKIHLVLSGRIRPTWDILTRLLVHGELLEITEADLAFTKEEVEVLFGDFYHLELNESQINYVYELTEGWIIAIQMIWQQFKITGDLEVKAHLHIRSLEELFRYLAMEVFSKQPSDIRQFLLATCIFDDFNNPFCNAVLKRQDSQGMIANLLSQNLFIIPIGTEQYRYHPLFKDFLIKQLRQDEECFYEYQNQAAIYFLAKEDYERAIYHYQKIDENKKIGCILEEYGQTLLQQGKIDAVSKMLERLTTNIKMEYRKLWFIEGEINRYFCHYERALTCYRQLEELADLNEDVRAGSLAHEGKAKIYLDTIQPAKADSHLSQSIWLMEQEQENPDRQIQLYSLMAENLVNLGKMKEALQWLNKCKAVQADFTKVELVSRYFLRIGELHQAKTLIETSTANQVSENPLTQSHRETDLILSIICSFMGELDKGKRLAERAILRGTIRKSPFVEACGWIRMGHVVQLDSKYSHELAIQCYETALGLMEKINMSRGKSEAYMGLTVLYGRLGNYEMAQKMSLMAIEEPNRVKDQWLAAFVHVSQAIAAIYCKEFEQAKRLLLEAATGFEKCDGKYGRTVTFFWLAKIAHDEENWLDFATNMEKFLQLVHEYDYEFFVTSKTLFGPKDLQLIIPMLLKAKELEIMSSNRLLATLGLEHLTFHPGYSIKVKTLGDFQVWLGHEKIHEKSWKREKAKELFQVFVTYKTKMFPKGELLQLLWHELDEDSAQRDFKVALNALNKAIEPGRQARSNPYFIQREDSLYGINKEAVLEVDSEIFELTIEKGLKEKGNKEAIEILTQGLTLYEGDYLPTRRYDDWCVEERERLQVLFLRGAEKLAQLYLENEGYDEAIYWSEAILVKDVCWEEAYRILMYAYYKKKNRTYALRIYERCCKVLQEELGIEPIDATKQIYKRIKKNANVELNSMAL
ncbi:transcriptional regulator [Anaerobacillus sp. CMMVII]|uniref:BTAD domain-containing putative transcriptional regulator n=1 Tax=Anaerobacillus sp. CMMVII TaxID=2755588 RepID=UPI0021B7CDC1|nr:BTAD domain-containing putative transcriptional regulator [Anaerobacillus sp. CMMVII]MCT8136788.1 transcriptional regulator [Anaerobacillus sp. CMMVII]